MIINHEKWDQPVFTNYEEPTLLVFRDLYELYLFQRELISQINGNDGLISIFDNDKPLKIDKEVEIIPNIFTLTINNRKTINFLHKNLVDEISKSNYVISFEELVENIKEWITNVRSETLVDFSFEERVEVTDILKLFKVEFSEREDKPIDLLIRYLDLIRSMTKTKIVFIPFATYLLNEEELSYLINYCKINEIILVLIEKENNKNPNISKVITVSDNCVLF